jgi:catalase
MVHTITFKETEILGYELEIRSLRAQKSHTRRWINGAKRMLVKFDWETPDGSAARISSAELSITRNEEQIAKLDAQIAMFKEEIAKLKSANA